MRPLSPARTCHMAAFQTLEAQREPHAHPFRPNALLDLNATSFLSTEAVVRSVATLDIAIRPRVRSVDEFHRSDADPSPA